MSCQPICVRSRLATSSTLPRPLPAWRPSLRLRGTEDVQIVGVGARAFFVAQGDPWGRKIPAAAPRWHGRAIVWLGDRCLDALCGSLYVQPADSKPASDALFRDGATASVGPAPFSFIAVVGNMRWWVPLPLGCLDRWRGLVPSGILACYLSSERIWELMHALAHGVVVGGVVWFSSFVGRGILKKVL